MPTTDTLFAKDYERLALNINPGGWAIEKQRPISTLLGSCVAVCLYDPLLQIGGMNHFMLPSRLKTANTDTDIILSGDYAMEILLNGLLGKGARKERLIAKAFGGGTIVTSIQMAIGERNATFAKEWLAREKIPLAASDFRGPWSRKVIFVPTTGEAFCKRIPTTQQTAAQVAKAELDYEKTLVKPAKGGDVELF
jgi:chemotaxis protein CheD